MQMTIDQARRPGLLLAFANRRSRGYMMRSERRSGYSGNGRRKPPRKRRTGFLYIFLTLLVSILLWPLGMVMLWRRKVTLQPGTKLLLSMMTLCISVFLIVFTLTVPVNNPEFTAFQDKANDVLDKTASKVAVAGDAAYRKGVRTWHVMEDFGDAAVNCGVKYLADGIDEGVIIGRNVKSRVDTLLKRDTSEIELEATPAPTPAGETAVTPPTAEASTKPEATDSDEPTEAPEETPTVAEAGAATEAPEAEPTDEAPGEAAPTEDSTAEAPADKEAQAEEADTATPAPDTTPVAAVHDTLNLGIPGESPDPSTGTPLSGGTLLAGGAFVEPAVDADAGEAPAEPEASAEPEPTPSALSTQSAVETPTEAEAEETPEATPEAEAAEETAPEEEATEEATAEAEVTEEAAPEAEEPAAEESPEPEAEEPETTPEATDVPAMTVTVKPAGEATVYFYNGGKAYHRKGCKTIGSDAPQRTLAEAIEAGKRVCGSCNPLSTNIMDAEHVAWVDADNVIHTTDECASFKGEWTLISLESAIENGDTGCPDCQGDLYAATVAQPVEAATVEPEAPAEEGVDLSEVTVVPDQATGADNEDDTAAAPLLGDADEDAEADEPIADTWTSEAEETEAPQETEAPEETQAAVAEPVTTIALKPAADATLYHSSNGKFYHRQSVCKGMTGSNAYRFGECVEQGFRQCPNCPAPAPELASIPCMWMDANGLCHTADTCAAFVGSWTLVPREDAMAQKMPGCTACGGDKYLVSYTGN